ncbi:DinB family protein [Zhihengliuella sp.]|uniref:DinB family protein n=1 Tax=Zhihengliuella sp. TaxID=1954483 RepID=UPI0028115323|nr:DinB family protein [Zhihengliuella sp.]
METEHTVHKTLEHRWNERLVEQLDVHWRVALRPRLEGLTDHEYRWEPVPDCWDVRPRGESGPAFDGALTGGAGDFTIDFAFPEPTPPPVTTIAWRLGHLIVGVLGARNASHFGGPAIDYRTHEYAGTSAAALEQLDDVYARWVSGVRGLGEDGLFRRCGPAEGPYAQSPLADLVLHINREVIHHGAEIALLRDLYVHRAGGTD